ncbi:hypothetical protein GLYMA_06G160700v4 [Glycine max]|uniref:Uncharacterized protein n=1 Tax=Glycine max TaxID=3847 RepID=K7KVD0_SOYBN|nr:hypothetical protein GYH30_015274 [Glycine max]KHN09679.1 hypothetical protein glysoja_011953 [Glycine soja]KRH54018.1 hypothetical protein GLYMA_06G160700v4 [Glycine max]
MTSCSFSCIISNNNALLRSSATLVVFTFGVVPRSCSSFSSGCNVRVCHLPQSLPLVG